MQICLPVIPFSTKTLPELGQVGQKALGLMELTRAGFPVPDGFAIAATAFHTFMETLPIERDWNPEDPSFETDLEMIRTAIAEAPMPDELGRAIAEAYSKLGGRVAVRSSATREDFQAPSGPSVVHLGVEGVDQVLLAVKECWASVWTPHVVSHRCKRGIPCEAMGVVVQALISAEVSGVLSTIHPVSGLEDETLIEACWGLYASGKVKPDRFLVRPQSIEATVAEKTTAVFANEKGPYEAPVAPREANKRCLSDSKLRELSRLGRKVMRHFGCPQHLDFAYAAERFYLLQARPITEQTFDGIPGEWSNAGFRDLGLAAPVSPYLASFIESIGQFAVPHFFQTVKLLEGGEAIDWTKLYYGRPYWNMGAIKRILSVLPGFKEQEFDRSLGIESSEGIETPFSPKTLWRALPSYAALLDCQRNRLAENETIVKAFPSIEAHFDKLDLSRLSLAEWGALYQKLIEDTFLVESAYVATILNAFLAERDFQALFKKKKISSLNARALVVGLDRIPHLEPLRELRSLAADLRKDRALAESILLAPIEKIPSLLKGSSFEDRLGRFFVLFRHHSIAERDWVVPRWDEDPSFVYQALKGFLQAPEGAYPEEDYRAERAKAEKGFLFGLGKKDFFAQLELVRQLTSSRETMRDVSTRMHYHIRRLSLALARKLARSKHLRKPEDLFFLSYREVLEILDGLLTKDETERLILGRIEQGECFKYFESPNEIGYRYPFKKQEGLENIRGIAASGGTAEGTVRVLASIADAELIRPGDILVTRYFDPGWTPLLGIVGALVAETGSFFSQAAVVARECALPAVLSVSDATTRLKDGQRVRVDGDAGELSLLPDS